MPAKVIILLLNWNNFQDTAKCLESLQGLTYGDWQILVLDNGSTDESVPRIQEKFPTVEVMALGANLGFGKGNNVGIRTALYRRVDYVWLLNNDTVVDPAALTAMVELAENDESIGAVGSVIYSMAEPERLRAWGGGHIDFLLGRGLHFKNCVENERIEFLTGASMLLRRKAVESIGLLDEGFFMYWEDADYCFRLRQAGWHLAVAGGSKVWHKEQGTIGKRNVAVDIYTSRSAARFFKRHASLPFVPIGVGILRRIVKWALVGDWGGVRSVCEASGLFGSSRQIPD